jgi:hypothetical protein
MEQTDKIAALGGNFGPLEGRYSKRFKSGEFSECRGWTSAVQ